MISLIHRTSVRQFLTYGLSVGGSMVFGFALVIALVRIVPAEVYGELVLTKALFLMIIAVFGLGLSQAAVRWAATETQQDLILGAVLRGILITAVPATVVFLAALHAINEDLVTAHTAPFILTSAVLVLSYLVNSELLNWYRANRLPYLYARFSVLRAFLQAFSVASTVFAIGDASGYVYGLAAGELVFSMALFYFYRWKFSFGSTLLREMLVYGVPHAIVIASSYVLNYTDRFMLSYLTSSTVSVAHYDAASVTAVSCMAILLRPFNLYILPAYTNKYEAEGTEATILFVNKCQRNFIICGLTMATALVLLRNVLMTTLFPPDYWFASEIIYFIAFSVLMSGIFLTVVAGLYISKQPLMVAAAAGIAVIFNFLANYFLIPVYGLSGAAAATALSGFVQLTVGYLFARRVLTVHFPALLIAIMALWLSCVDRYFPAL